MDSTGPRGAFRLNSSPPLHLNVFLCMVGALCAQVLICIGGGGGERVFGWGGGRVGCARPFGISFTV